MEGIVGKTPGSAVTVTVTSTVRVETTTSGVGQVSSPGRTAGGVYVVPAPAVEVELVSLAARR